MNLRKFNFRKRIRRNAFTTIFGGVGTRRIVQDYRGNGKEVIYKRTTMQRHRRANQGYKNRIYGSITALQIRREFGRYPTVSLFRR